MRVNPSPVYEYFKWTEEIIDRNEKIQAMKSQLKDMVVFYNQQMEDLVRKNE